MEVDTVFFLMQGSIRGIKKTLMKVRHVIPISKQAWQAEEEQKEVEYETFTTSKGNIVGESLIIKA